MRRLGGLVENLAPRTLAVAATGQGDGTWLIDADGAPVGQGWLWLDARAAEAADRLRAHPDDRARFHRTGAGINACQMGPQLLRMAEIMPEALDAASTAFHCKDWLFFRMTGLRATDPSEGVFSFGDFHTRDYRDEVIDFLGLTARRGLLPPILDGARERGALSAEAAAATGLAAGAPVVLAYVDVICTALGGGLFDAAEAPGCSIVGSTGMHMRLALGAGRVTLNHERTGYTMATPAPGVHAQMQSNMSATINLDWVLGLARGILEAQGVARSNADLLGTIDQGMARSEPGGLIYHPCLSEAGERGPFVDPRARAGFVGLSTRHGYADLVRAVFEGLGFAARDCYGAMGEIPHEIRLSGGAARSPSLRRILAAATGARVRGCAREEAGAAGAAMIAAVSLGLYPSMKACAAEWVTPLLGGSEAPDADLARICHRTFPAYRSAREALRPVWRIMAQTGETRG